VGRIVREIRGRLAREPDVDFAFLFGSVVKGHARTGSDIDVAVHLASPESAAGRLDRALKLEGALEEPLGRPVQVTVLNDAPLELRYNVLSHGELVHCPDDAARQGFFVETGRRYYDMEPARAIFRRYQARRIREGTFGG